MKRVCISHYIKLKEINALVLADICSMIQQVVEDEIAAKNAFLAKKQTQRSKQTADDKKRLSDGKRRLDELATLIPKIYEDKVLGKVPEDVCIDLLQNTPPSRKSLPLLSLILKPDSRRAARMRKMSRSSSPA